MPEEVIAKEEKPLIEEIRDKSFEQILREQRNPVEEKKEEVVEPTEEEKKAKEEQEAKDAEEKIKAEEAAQAKRDADIAAKAAQDVIDAQKKEEQEKADKVKQEEEEAKRQEDLKPKFTGKDKDGNVVPASYEELHAEDARVAAELAADKIRQELKDKEDAKNSQDETAKAEKVKQEAAQKGFEEQLQKELDEDLKAIYAAGDMPKITDPKDENELGNKEYKNLFETAQRINAKRAAEGKTLIRSIQTIRYGKDETGKPYYTPLAKPAGHDAPVLGSESTLSNELPEDQYIPSRDRGKSMTQLVKEEAQRLTRKLNIRGN
jgi:membrane protein involved in colicin uptake